MKSLVLTAGALLILALGMIGTVALEAIPVPYSQNFDACVPPALPDGWIALESGDSNSLVATQAANSHSTPNKIVLYEGPSDDFVMLVMPPLDDGIPLQHVSLWWWARSYLNQAQLQVGILEDLEDMNSFVSLTPDIPLNNYYTQYHLSLAIYPGSVGRRLAFKAGNPSNCGLFIDDVELRYNPSLDMECVQLEVLDPYQVGHWQEYSTRVINQGIEPVSFYTCQLLDGEDGVLSQESGFNLGAGIPAELSFNHFITTPGNHKLSAKVVCDGDLEPANDQSPPRIVKVLAEGVEGYAIPADWQYHGKYPIDLYWKTSMCQTLYLASELPQQDKYIHGLKYAAQIHSPDIGIKPIKIWMGLTSLENLSAGWISAFDMQLVFDGETDFPAGEYPSYFCFPQPFEYLAGSNLAILVLRPLDFRYYTSMDDFYHDNTSIIRTRHVKSDTAIYDPYNPPAASEPLTARPVTTLYVTDPITAADDPLAPVISSLSAWPNPFRDKVTLSWKQTGKAPAILSVYNLRGQLQRRVTLAAGDGAEQSCSWNAIDDHGRKLPTGIYLMKLEQGGRLWKRKVMLVR